MNQFGHGKGSALESHCHFHLCFIHAVAEKGFSRTATYMGNQNHVFKSATHHHHFVGDFFTFAPQLSL